MSQTLPITASPEWIARALLRLAREPNPTKTEDDGWVKMLVGYITQRTAVEEAAPELLAACVEEVAWFDDLQENSHPDDDRLRAERRRIHGPRIDRARAAIAKAVPAITEDDHERETETRGERVEAMIVLGEVDRWMTAQIGELPAADADWKDGHSLLASVRELVAKGGGVA